ncbi:MAG: DUF4189 domain-containing protein [Sulfurimonas sp.]|jgi:hypothetical protein
MKLVVFLVLACMFGSYASAAGAIAIDSNQGKKYGFAYKYPSVNAAEQRALSECGGGCSIVETFENGCAAYAADQSQGSTAYGYATGLSSGSVQNVALSECQSHGGTACIVRVWGCD